MSEPLLRSTKEPVHIPYHPMLCSIECTHLRIRGGELRNEYGCHFYHCLLGRDNGTPVRADDCILEYRGKGVARHRGTGNLRLPEKAVRRF